MEGKRMLIVKDTTDKLCIFTNDGTQWFLKVNGKTVVNQGFTNPYEAFIFYQKNSFNLEFDTSGVEENV
jgi:hypothetical protein